MNAPFNGPIMTQKAEEYANRSNEYITDRWFNKWKSRENDGHKQHHGVQSRSDFMAASQWMKTEWPNITA